MIWRTGTNEAGLEALSKAADRLAAAGQWLTAAPDGAWLPEPEATSLGAQPQGAG
jgi:hypothetical protein